MKNGKSGMLGSALLAIFGAVLILKPDFGSAAVAAVLGWVLILLGAAGLAIAVLGKDPRSAGKILLQLAVLALGIYLVKRPLALASLLGVLLGGYLLLQGVSSGLEALKLKKNGYGFVPNLLLAGIMAVFGIALLAAPLTASQLIMKLIGLAMLVCGVVGLVLRFRAAKQLQSPKESPKIIDAE